MTRQHARRAMRVATPVRGKGKLSEAKSLTIRQARLARILCSGSAKSYGEAAVAAGYSAKNARQSGYQALQQILAKAPEVMSKLGLTLESVIDKHLRPLLDASAVKIVQRKGRFTDWVELPDNATRLHAVQTVLKLHGAYPSEEELQRQHGVEVVIIDVPRPDRSALKSPASEKPLPPARNDCSASPAVTVPTCR